MFLPRSSQRPDEPPPGYRTTGQPPPGYRTLHMQALNGRIPAEMVNGRWRLKRADLVGIAEYLGVIEPAQQATAPVWSVPYRQPQRLPWSMPWSMAWAPQPPMPRPQPGQPTRQPRRKVTSAA